MISQIRNGLGRKTIRTHGHMCSNSRLSTYAFFVDPRLFKNLCRGTDLAMKPRRIPHHVRIIMLVSPLEFPNEWDDDDCHCPADDVQRNADLHVIAKLVATGAKDHEIGLVSNRSGEAV